jgi:chromosomal replication initiation ATPase DnaA
MKKLTEAGKESLRRLEELRAEVSKAEGKDVGETEFAQRLLPFSGATYRALLDESYSGDIGQMETRCRQAIVDVERFLELRSSMRTRDLVKTQTVLACMEAMERARANTASQNRLVLYLAPTGGGKSELCSAICRRFKAVRLQGRETWRMSYSAFCSDVVRATGDREFQGSARQAEDEMLRVLRQRTYALAIDECNTLGPAAANAIKLILNETPTFVFVSAIPVFWDRLRSRAWSEASQLIRRCVLVVRHEVLTVEDVRPFLRACMTDKDALQHACKTVAGSGSLFGMYDVVVRVCDRLSEEFPDPSKVLARDVDKALLYVRSTLSQPA